MVESKFEAFQSTIITLRKCLAEKDDYISDLEKRVKNLEVDVKSIHDININSDKEKLRKIGTLFECSKCHFSTKSEQGLKVHIGKKHTEQTFLRKCILCEKTFTSYTTFKCHKYEHSNWKKESNTYSCKDCDFIAKNETTYLLHIYYIYRKTAFSTL